MPRSGTIIEKLLLILALPGISIAQGDESVVTAREHYDQVKLAARAAAQDAELIMVTSGDIVEPGEAHTWGYFFRSVSSNQVLSYVYEQDDLSIRRQTEVNPEFPISLHAGMTPIPDGWIDSPVALAAANANGGSDFTATQGKGRVLLFLLPAFDGGVNVLYKESTWAVEYTTGDVRLVVPVNATTGTFLDQGLMTARRLYVDVESLARDDAADAELIHVSTFYAEPDGSSSNWFYYFQSPSQSTLLAYHVQDGRVGRRSEPIETNQNLFLGMPALPVNWLDSDETLKETEQRGGSAFRQANAQWTIDAFARTTDSGLPEWFVVYRAPSGEEVFIVDAFSGNPVTARSKLDGVLTRSLQEYSDAQLVLVRSPDIDPQGQSRHWSFVFKSTSKPDIFGVYVLGGEVQSAIEPIGLNGPLDVFMPPLPDQWLDSDKALETAEQRGGSDYRQNQSEWHIDAEMRFSESGWLEWYVYYTSPSDSATFVVDALGNPVTARKMLPDVLARSLQEAADARLVSVSSPRLDFEGKSSRWSYIFKAVNREDLFEVSVAGGEVLDAINPVEPNQALDPGMPAMPDEWLDSDSAVVISERLGGSEFRSTHTDATLDVSVRWRESPPTRSRNLGPRPIFVLFYRSGLERHVVAIDLEVGPFNDLPRSSAREKLDLLADSVEAAGLPEDARLINVNSITVDHAGEAEQWAYVYESPTENQHYEFRVLGGHVIRPDTVYAGFGSGATPIPEGWIDSHLAMKVAEQNGGQEFRQAHPDYAIMLDLHASGHGVFWNASYGTESAFEQFTVDAMDRSVAVEPAGLPEHESTLKVYPNPVSSSASVAFTLSQSSEASLVVYDILGRQRLTILQGFFQAGAHMVPLSADALEPGLYFFLLTSGDQIRRGRMTIIR